MGTKLRKEIFFKTKVSFKDIKSVLKGGFMIYSNGDARAAEALEYARLGAYGEADYGEKRMVCCPVCGMNEPDYLYINDNEDCVGCSECVMRTEVY